MGIKLAIKNIQECKHDVAGGLSSILNHLESDP